MIAGQKLEKTIKNLMSTYFIPSQGRQITKFHGPAPRIPKVATSNEWTYSGKYVAE